MKVINDDAIRTGAAIAQTFCRYSMRDPRESGPYADDAGYCIDRPMVMPAGSCLTNCSGSVIGDLVLIEEPHSDR